MSEFEALQNKMIKSAIVILVAFIAIFIGFNASISAYAETSNEQAFYLFSVFPVIASSLSLHFYLHMSVTRNRIALIDRENISLGESEKISLFIKKTKIVSKIPVILGLLTMTISGIIIGLRFDDMVSSIPLLTVSVVSTLISFAFSIGVIFFSQTQN